MSDSKGAKFLEGVLFGAIVGAAAGLLLAPRAGEETRKAVLEKGREILGRMDGYLRESRDSIEIAIAEGQKAGEETSEVIRESMEEVLEEAQEPQEPV